MDVRVEDFGSIVLLHPESDDARVWFEDHIGRGNGYQPYWPTVVAEPRYVEAILEGLAEEGFEVKAR